MKQVEVGAQRGRQRSGFFGLVLGIGLAWGGADAQAGEVYWSLGMQSPGIVVGASNAAPVYVAPAPVVVYPAPRVMVQPVYGSAWAPPGHYKRRHHKHHWKHEQERWEDGGRYGYGRP